MREWKDETLLITRNRDLTEWSVWITLAGHDPLTDAFGFIVGGGDTRESAVAAAVAALEDATQRLQSPAGDIPEREV